MPETSATGNHDRTLDVELLRSWKALSDGKEDDFLKEVILLFLETAPLVIRELRKEDSDRGSLKRLAHKLRGSTANLGALALSDFCAELEQRADDSSKEWIDQTITNIETEFAKVKARLEKDFL